MIIGSGEEHGSQPRGLVLLIGATGALAPDPQQQGWASSVHISALSLSAPELAKDGVLHSPHFVDEDKTEASEELIN